MYFICLSITPQEELLYVRVQYGPQQKLGRVKENKRSFLFPYRDNVPLSVHITSATRETYKTVFTIQEKHQSLSDQNNGVLCEVMVVEIDPCHDVNGIFDETATPKSTPDCSPRVPV